MERGEIPPAQLSKLDSLAVALEVDPHSLHALAGSIPTEYTDRVVSIHWPLWDKIQDVLEEANEEDVLRTLDWIGKLHKLTSDETLIRPLDLIAELLTNILASIQTAPAARGEFTDVSEASLGHKTEVVARFHADPIR